MPQRRGLSRRRAPSNDEIVIAVTESHPDLLRLNTPSELRLPTPGSKSGFKGFGRREETLRTKQQLDRAEPTHRGSSSKKRRMPPSLTSSGSGGRGSQDTSHGQTPPRSTGPRLQRRMQPPPLPSDTHDLAPTQSRSRALKSGQNERRTPPSMRAEHPSFGTPKFATEQRAVSRAKESGRNATNAPSGHSSGAQSKRSAEYYHKLAADAKVARQALSKDRHISQEGTEQSGRPSDTTSTALVITKRKLGRSVDQQTSTSTRANTSYPPGLSGTPASPSLEDLATSGAPPSPGASLGNDSESDSFEPVPIRGASARSRLPPSMMSPLTTPQGRIMKHIASGRSLKQPGGGVRNLSRGASRHDIAKAMAEDERAAHRKAWEQVVGPLPAPAAAAMIADEMVRRATQMPSWHAAREGSDFFEQRANHAAKDREQRGLVRKESGRVASVATSSRTQAKAQAQGRIMSTTRKNNGASASRSSQANTDASPDLDEASASELGANDSPTRRRLDGKGSRRQKRRSRRGELDENAGAAPDTPPLRSSDSFRSAEQWASVYGDDATSRTKQAVREAQLAAEQADREAAEAAGDVGCVHNEVAQPEEGSSDDEYSGARPRSRSSQSSSGINSVGGKSRPRKAGNTSQLNQSEASSGEHGTRATTLSKFADSGGARSPSGQQADASFPSDASRPVVAPPAPQQNMSLGPYRKFARDLERAKGIVQRGYDSALQQEATLQQQRDAVEKERLAAEARKEELAQSESDLLHEADAAEASLLPGGSMSMRREEALKDINRLRSEIAAVRAALSSTKEATKRRVAEIEGDIGMEGLKADQREHRLLEIEAEVTHHLDRAREQVSLAHEEAGLIQDQRDEIELMKQSLALSGRSMQDLRRVVTRSKVLAEASERTAAGQLAAEQSRLESTTTGLERTRSKCLMLQKELAQVYEETAELTGQLSQERRQLLKLQEQATQAVLRDAAAISEAAKQSARLKRLDVVRKATADAASAASPKET